MTQPSLPPGPHGRGCKPISRRACLSAVLLAFSRTAHADCRLYPAATVPLRIIEGFPVIDAAVGANKVTFLLDTGAQAHLVLPQAQAMLSFPILPGAVPLIGTGGARKASIVLLEGVRLGSILLEPAPTPVAPLPLVPRVTPMLAGLLGAPLLDRFDLHLDAASRLLGLYDAAGCGGARPDFARRMTTIPLEITRDRQALLPVAINGQLVTALLDTGSRATLLTEDAANRLGLRAPLSANTARGVDGEALPVAHLRVREMSVGNDVRRNAPLSIAPVQLGRADMLLGLDYLRERQVWISYVTRRLAIALPGPAS